MRGGLPYVVLLVSLVFYFVTERFDLALVAATDHRTPVTFWGYSLPAQTMTRLKGRFEANHPDVRLEIQTVPWQSLQEKTLWAIAANANVPDLVVCSSEWVGGLANSGGLQPMDEIVSEEFLDRYFASVLDIYKYPHVDRSRPGEHGPLRQYGIPLDLDMMLVFYRADRVHPVMEELAMDVFPETWDAFERLARAVRDNSPQPGYEHLLYLDPDDPVPMSMAFLPASGGRFLTPDRSRAVFNSPEGTAAFEFFGRLLQNDMALRWERSTMENPLVLFKTGRALANIAGPWYTKNLEYNLPEQAGRWRVALFPSRERGLPTSGLGGACLAMPHNAPHKEEARLLLEFIASDEFALEYFRSVGSPPPQKSAWTAPVFSEPHPYFGGQEVYTLVRRALDTAVPLALMPSSEVTKGPVRRAMRDIAVNRADPQATLDRAVETADDILRTP